MKMDTLVSLRTRKGTWWLRPLSNGSKVMVIPVVNGIPIVHRFEIIEKEEIYREPDDQARNHEVSIRWGVRS